MMRKYLCFFPILVFSAIVLTGCEKDQSYYDSHLDAAKDKFQACKKEAQQAFIKGDKKQFNKIENDKACNFARNALLKAN